MTRILIASAASLGMMISVAGAETATVRTTTTTVPTLVNPSGTVRSVTTTVPAAVAPVVTVDSTKTESLVNPDGTKTTTIERTHRNGDGVVTGTSTSQTNYPFSRMVTTKTTSQ